MKRLTLIIALLVLAAVFLSGCDVTTNTEQQTPQPTKEAVPTLEEVISGKWEVYSFYDGGGALVKIADTDFKGTMNYTFDANGNFSGVIDNAEAGINSAFTGKYDVTESQKVEADPYKWYYYGTIDKTTIKDSGMFSFITKMGEQGLHLILKFREVDGEKLLFDEAQSYYYKKQ